MTALDPQKRAILAGEYVLGTLPRDARARFERLMRHDAVLARLVDQWARRFSVIDARTPAVVPPARIWRAIAARTLPPALAPRHSWRDSLAFWRMASVGALATAIVLLAVLLTGVWGPVAKPELVAVLAGKDGEPAWLVTTDRRHEDLSVAAVKTQAIDPQHAFELWVVADNKPLPLGLIPPERDHAVTIPATALPKDGLVLAVSLEPPGGSPTGAPTGPVLYQGRILTN